MMQKPARGKWKLIIRRAVTPMAYISSEGLKKDSSIPGASWKTAKPRVMMQTAEQMVSFMVRRTRSRRAAP
jgi:hypothetical protein